MPHVLVVDDEESIREVLRAQIGDFGHSVDAADSGEEALRKLEARDYDLIVCDLGMPTDREPTLRRACPGLQRSEVGLEFLRHVYPRTHQRTPVIVLTAWAEFDHAVKAMRVGVCNFLPKPWDRQTLRSAIQGALELRQFYILRERYQRELETEVQRARAELQLTYEGTLTGMASMLEGKDTSTMDHCQRVADLCERLAVACGVGGELLRDVRLGAMLHDIGKYKVPDSILKKAGPLTPEEWVEMRRHPEYGADFVRQIPFLKGAEAIILNHHEKYDGTGYPHKLHGDDIPLPARIFAVVDAYDAMRDRRCYKAGDPHSPEAALEELLRCAGTQFDPRIVDAFVAMIREEVSSTGSDPMERAIRERPARNGSARRFEVLAAATNGHPVARPMPPVPAPLDGHL